MGIAFYFDCGCTQVSARRWKLSVAVAKLLRSKSPLLGSQIKRHFSETKKKFSVVAYMELWSYVSTSISGFVEFIYSFYFFFFSNRKGKLIFFYEWNVKLKWKGTLTPEDPPTDTNDDKEEEPPTEYSGEIEIPNLSEENDPEDIDVSVWVCL